MELNLLSRLLVPPICFIYIYIYIYIYIEREREREREMGPKEFTHIVIITTLAYRM
jgi:hypothetical protein